MNKNIKIAKQLVKIARTLIAQQGNNQLIESIRALKQLVNGSIKNQYKEHLDQLKKNLNTFKAVNIPEGKGEEEFLEGDVKKLIPNSDILYNNFIDIYNSSYDKDDIIAKLDIMENMINSGKLSSSQEINKLIQDITDDVNEQNMILQNSISYLKDFSDKITTLNNDFSKVQNAARVAGMMDEIKNKMRRIKIQFLMVKRFIKQLFTPVQSNAEQIKENMKHLGERLKYVETIEEKWNNYALSENPQDLI